MRKHTAYNIYVIFIFKERRNAVDKKLFKSIMLLLTAVIIIAVAIIRMDVLFCLPDSDLSELFYDVC